MRFAFIAKHRHVWPVSWLCEALDVSRSGFHAWLRRGPSAREAADEGLTAKIRSSFVGSARTYGARRVWRNVLAEGLSCSLHKVERLMRMNALRARPRRRRLPKDNGARSPSVAPNLLDRQFAAERPNQRWIADFTYIWTAEGWLYVAAVIDLFSRRVVGWSMKAEMTAQLVTDALVMAIWRRGRPDALVHHSNQGSQYTSEQVPASDGRQWRRLFDEPVRQRLGQRRDGELLFLAQNRADWQQGLPYAGRRQSRRVRLHRTVLQHDPQALDHRISQPG